MALVAVASGASALALANLAPRDRAGDGPERAPVHQGTDAGESASQLDLDGASRASGGPSRDAIRAAVERALAYLAKAQGQQPDGSFPPAGADQYAPLASTALGALAFLATGNTLSRGPYQGNVEAAIDYLLARAESAGSVPGFIADPGRDKLSRTHGHGFATLALAEAFDCSPRTPRGQRIARALTDAVHAIEASQGIEGGWSYELVRSIEHEGSVTITLVQGLRAAKQAGIRVEPKVIAKAVSYVERSQKEDGSFRYQLGDDKSSVALTAAALATLQATGEYTGAHVNQGFDYLERELAAREAGNGTPQGDMYRPHYERLYLAQALWQNPDPRLFESWYAKASRELLATQGEDGSWTSQYYGSCYATAMCVLALSVPDGMLPIFQR